MLKVVVFDEEDLLFARNLSSIAGQLPLFLLAGTDIGLSEDETLRRLRGRYAWLCEVVARSPEFEQARVLPQLHVVAWGVKPGV